MQMSKLCTANGIHYYHFLQPNQYLENSKLINSKEQKIAFELNGTRRNNIQYCYPILRNEGRRLQNNGVNFCDLTMIFSNENRTLYTDDCCHINYLGNKIMADAIADYIMQSLKSELEQSLFTKHCL